MIIKLKDLDVDVLSKLNQLDDLKKNYINDPRKTVVSFNGKDFSLVRFPEVEKIEFSENDITDLQIAMHQKRQNCKSSLLEDMRIDDKLHIATKSFYTELPEFPVIQCENDILKIYTLNNIIFTYDTDGMLTKFVKNAIVKAINIPNLLYSVFSVNAGTYSIVDFSVVDENTLMFITDRGVYRLHFESEELEFIIPEPHTRVVKQINDNMILCGTDNYIVLYRGDSGKKISKFYNISKAGQVPFKIVQAENRIFVLCKNVGLDVLSSFIHCFEIDGTGLNCSIKDDIIYPLTEAQNQKLKVAEGNLYILNKNSLLYYSLTELNQKPEKITLEKNIDDFEVINGNILILSDSTVFLYKKGELVDTVLLPGKPSQIFFNSDFYYLNENKLSRFFLPVYQNNTDTLVYRIINDPCNNIDILIDGIDRDNLASFYDAETLAVIKPSYFAIYNGKALIKITGCSAKKINMALPVHDGMKVNGFVVRRNHLFLK